MQRWQRARRNLKRGGLAVLGGALLYVGLLLHPDPLFAHTLTHSTLVAHADVPIPDAMTQTLAGADERIRSSPLFDPARRHDVYFCQAGWRWALVSHWNQNAAGFALAPADRVVFFRRARLDADRMIGPSGREVEGERTLAYYVAHEVAHTMTADHLGLAYYDLPIWVREGYADYVARHGTFDYEAVRRQLLEGAPETDPASGHYLRYVLLVAHELDVTHQTLDALLRHPRSRDEVEADVVAGR
jgi:hypothetical protein